MNWESVGKAVSVAAPILGTVLGGPVGLIAGAAGSLLASALGCEPDPDAVLKAVADPASLVKIREIEAGERARLLEWQAVQLNADLENVKSARAREVQMTQAGSAAAWATTGVAILVTIGFFAMLWIVLSGKQDNINEAAILLLGTLAAGFGAVINYYLGSSLGSARKDATISRIGESK
jgi:hypothetical protein